MASPTNNWVYEKNGVNERDKALLEKAKKIERRKLRQGYRWIRINQRMRALIECDKNGNPTPSGQAHIERLKGL